MTRVLYCLSRDTIGTTALVAIQLLDCITTINIFDDMNTLCLIEILY